MYRIRMDNLPPKSIIFCIRKEGTKMMGKILINVGNIPNFYFKPRIEKICGETSQFFIVANAGGTRRISKGNCIPYTAENWALCEEAIKLFSDCWKIQITLSNFRIKEDYKK
jgi:hypothetical protein